MFCKGQIAISECVYESRSPLLPMLYSGQNNKTATQPVVRDDQWVSNSGGRLCGNVVPNRPLPSLSDMKIANFLSRVLQSAVVIV